MALKYSNRRSRVDPAPVDVLTARLGLPNDLTGSLSKLPFGQQSSTMGARFVPPGFARLAVDVAARQTFRRSANEQRIEGVPRHGEGEATVGGSAAQTL